MPSSGAGRSSTRRVRGGSPRARRSAGSTPTARWFAPVALRLGAEHAPATVGELAEVIAGFRPELAGSPQAREAVRHLLTAPLPWTARVPYGTLCAAAFTSLPLWARRMLGGPRLPIIDDIVIPKAGYGLFRPPKVRGMTGADLGRDTKRGFRCRITNRVIELEKGRRMARRHFNCHIWRYVFDQNDDTTVVSEQWDASHEPLLRSLVGFPKRNRRGMEAMLERLQGSDTEPPDAQSK